MQLEVESALSDLRHYSELHRSVGEIAAELEVYRRSGKHGLVADLYKSNFLKDRRASLRLAAAHRARTADDLETRDVGGGQFSTLPTWLTQDAGPTSIATAPTIAAFAKPLPTGLTAGSLNLVRFTTAPVASPQSALNAALAEPTIAEGSVGPSVRTFGARVRLSVQLVEQGSVGLDAVLLPALSQAVDAAIDNSCLNGDNTGGAVLGIRSTSGISTNTYVDATPTLAEMLPTLETLVRSCETGQGGAPFLIAHPRRLSWMRQRSATENVRLDLRPSDEPGVTATMHGTIRVIADSNMATTLGAGTEDVVLVARSADVIDLRVGPTRVQMGPSPDANATVYLNVWRQCTFSAGRLPAALGVLSGTGLIAP